VRAPTIGLAVGHSQLAAARRAAGSAPATAWCRTLSVPAADSSEWSEELGGAFAEMRETLETPFARLAVTLLPPLVQVRVLSFPRLRLAEIRRVVARDAAKYFPGVREPQVVAVAPVTSGRRGPIEVLAAGCPAWILERISEAVRAAGCAAVSFEPAHSGWVRWARGQGCELIAVIEAGSAELIRANRGRLTGVRRVPASPARIESVLAEMGGGPQSVFGEAQHAEAAAIAACSAGGKVELELVSDAEAASRLRRARRLTVRLWMAAAAGVLLVLGLHRTVLVRELEAFESARAAQREAVETALAARESSMGVETRLDALAGTRAAAEQWTEVLHQVATGLPADAYLTALRGTADSIVIDGVARRAAGVFEGLQRATRLATLRPAGPIRQEIRDSGPPIERFTASATLRSPAEPKAKAP
jgi:hypothetical protein